MIRRLAFTNLFLVIFMGTLFAQSADTVYVPAELSDGTPYVNSLIDKVVADTNTAGQQLHKVYKLERGKFYLLDKAMNLRNPVELVADPPVPGVPPAKILSNINASGGTATNNLINTWADIKIKNIWLGGTDVGGNGRGWGQGNALMVQDSLVRVHLDGVWADYNGWAAFSTKQPHTKWYINNFHTRNEQNPGDQWTTFLLYFEPAKVIDTLIVKNSTYFQSNSCFLFPPTTVLYLEVDHCTFVNTLKHPFHQHQWLKAKFTNNIFYNAGSLAFTPKEAESQDPHGLPYGLINVDTLTGNVMGQPGPYTIPENQRSIIVKNNLWYFSKEIQDYWATHDSVVPQPFMNERTAAMFANDAVWPGLVAENNWNQDPKFNDFPDLSAAVAKLAQVCNDIRAGNTHEWDWDSDQQTDPDFYRILIQYPLPENFRSYSGLKGTDGNPLGDLTYYPASELVSVEQQNGQIPATFELKQNYPNPFNPTTQIGYQINKSGHVTLSVYNLLGQKVKTLVNELKAPGYYSVVWDGKNDSGYNIPAGVYFYKLEMENNVQVKKMMLLK